MTFLIDGKIIDGKNKIHVPNHQPVSDYVLRENQ
jgi:hypothetical protein